MGRYCKSCGYDLAGIAAGVCPECSRAFDGADAATYDALPRATRRRRLVRRAAVLVAVAVVLGVLFPRGYVQGRLSVTGADGGATETVRTELIPPRWLARSSGVRYPRWTSRAAVLSGNGGTLFSARGVRFTLRGTETMGSCSASGSGARFGPLTINGFVAVPENAAEIFETVLPNLASGRAFGVRTGRAPVPPKP